MNPKIWLSSPHMGANEEVYVKNAFETNWIAPLGPYVDGFEKALADFNRVKSVAALSSGTAAIHLALVILGVKPGDEVICQSFTFSASANPILYQGAIPVFVDSEPDTWNMSPYFLKMAIEDGIARGKKPKAIIPVHLYGMPANMQQILAIAVNYGIPVVEDAAEALGSAINGKPCGSFGDIGILSFNGNKIITTSSGGALLSDDDEIVKKARFLSTQARDNAPHYQHSSVGYNYRMSNVCAAIGQGQMEVLPDRVKQRRNNYHQYYHSLAGMPGISFLKEPDGFFSNRWLTTILVEQNEFGFSREDIRLALERLNIESRPLWKPMHLQPVFAGTRFFGSNVSEQLFNKGLCLPSGSNLSTEDVNKVISVVMRLGS